MPLGLNLTSLYLYLLVEGYPIERWSDLVADARLLYDRLVVGPTYQRIKLERMRGGR